MQSAHVERQTGLSQLVVAAAPSLAEGELLPLVRQHHQTMVADVHHLVAAAARMTEAAVARPSGAAATARAAVATSSSVELPTRSLTWQQRRP